MPNNLVEVITLSSSDEDSNPKVETTQNVAKKRKLTARKSLRSTATIRNTTIKDKPPPIVSMPTKDKKATVSHVQLSSTKPSTSSNEHQQQNAQKPLPNTNSRVHKVVSTPTTSPNPAITLKSRTVTVNNVQFNSTKPSTTSSEHQQQNAQKPLINSNSHVHKVVSTPTTTRNLATIASKSLTVTASGKLSVSNSATNTASKMSGVTITPSNKLLKGKVSPTVQTNCGTKGQVNLNKHFNPTSTSTPKMGNNLNSPNANHMKTLPDSNKHINTKAPIATSQATTEAKPSSSINKLAKTLPGSPSVKHSDSEIPTSLLASLGKAGVTITKNAVNGKNHESVTTSTGKQNEKGNLVNAGMTKGKPPNCLPVVPTGVTIEKIAVNGKILEATTAPTDKQKVNASMIKEKMSNKFVPAGKNGLTITKTAGTISVAPTISTQKSNVLSAATKEIFLNSFVPVDRLFKGSMTASKSRTEKKCLTKQTTEEIAGISSIATKSGTTVTPVTQVNKQTTPQNNTKVTHTTVLPRNIMTTNIKTNFINKGKLETIVGSLSASTQVKDDNSKLHCNATSGKYISTLPKSIPNENKSESAGDSLSSLRSNKAVTILPVSEVATSSKNSQSQKVNSKNIKVASKKRLLFESDSQNDGTNKKAKLTPKPRLNGIQTNLATAEDNMKRISALKLSLKIIEGLTKSSDSAKHLKESSNSGIKGPVNNTKIRQHAKDLGNKTSRPESIPTKNLNSDETKSVSNNKKSMKEDKNEKPLKQVTSPKLSLKRKQMIIDASAPQNISNTAIPLNYFPLQPSAKKVKLASYGISEVPIPMGWKTEEKSKASSVEPNQGVSKNSVSAKVQQNSVPLHISSQKDTSGTVEVWDISDDNATKFNKLLEYSKSFMTATLTEKSTIVKNFLRLFKKADPSYVESSEFCSLLDSTLLKITDSNDTFIHLQKVKTELKAYKKSKNTTPSKPRRLSSSSDLSEAVSVASNLELPSAEPPKQVPTPNLADELASAIFPNFKIKETGQSIENNAADAFYNVPCSSKQADIIENLNFSMPVNNGVKLPSEFRTKASDMQRASVDKPSMSIPTSSDAFSASEFKSVDSDPVPMLPKSDPEIEVVNEVVTATQNVSVLKETLLKNLNLQSVDRLSAHPANAVQSEPQVNNLPPIPVIESVHQPKTSINNTHPVKNNLTQRKQETNILPPMCVPEVDQPKTSVETIHPDDVESTLTAQSKQEMEDNLPPTSVQEGVHQNKTFIETTLSVTSDVAQSNEEGSNLPPTSAQEGGDQPKSLMSKIEKRVHLLETHLGKLDKKIKKLQAKELSMDDLDDADSTYILEDKYKRKFQKTWAVLCKLKKQSALVGREIERRFHYHGCRHSNFNKAIEKLVNKRKPAEKFPNYVEVHNLLKKVNERAHLSLSDYEIENAARESFEAIGKELKRRRRADEDRDFGCYLTDDIRLETDPAEHDEELKKKLTDSVLEGEKKIAEIIEKYAAREDPNAETGEVSNCEEDDREEELNIDTPPVFRIEKTGSLQCEDSVAEGSLQDPVGIEVTAKPFEDTDLPDTAPATPETDEREDNATPPISISRPTTDVIDIDSSSSASTDPGPNATERNTISSNFVAYQGSTVFISDMIEIVDEPPPNYDDSSAELPPLAELCKM